MGEEYEEQADEHGVDAAQDYLLARTWRQPEDGQAEYDDDWKQSKHLVEGCGAGRRYLEAEDNF